MIGESCGRELTLALMLGFAGGYLVGGLVVMFAFGFFDEE